MEVLLILTPVSLDVQSNEMMFDVHGIPDQTHHGMQRALDACNALSRIITH